MRLPKNESRPSTPKTMLKPVFNVSVIIVKANDRKDAEKTATTIKVGGWELKLMMVMIIIGMSFATTIMIWIPPLIR